jgi:glutamine phosphoribosylpyrophosphate amidotransferase
MIDFKKLKYEESLKDHCGVFGIYASGEDVAKITYYALHSLQHRGQESAGIAVSDGHKLRSIRNLGLVTSVFHEENLNKLKGYIAIGHNRYSTTGGNTKNNIQPVILSIKNKVFAVSHNGNIVNAGNLASKLGNIKYPPVTLKYWHILFIKLAESSGNKKLLMPRLTFSEPTVLLLVPRKDYMQFEIHGDFDL